MWNAKMEQSSFSGSLAETNFLVRNLYYPTAILSKKREIGFRSLLSLPRYLDFLFLNFPQEEHSMYFQAYLWGWPSNTKKVVHGLQSRLVK